MTNTEAIKYAKENIIAYTSEMAEFNVLAIEALEKQATSEWIPTSERLPEEYTTVLISVEFGGVKFGYRTSLGEWVDESGGYRACYGDVLAWMPLPEPYKEGEQE